ncbi:uncharacterized protein N7484_009735 [Penicillium longicatenatum]|uniref:uncharacterized protein n=1 Tax=Penicillium longicatenatum TaxID=1561947 RepID=UPI002547BD2A|nr:uncharacterized protein N7484_009735 [Penicillium longicatenatum]KAJ5636422.1 hypothetical protein N7484_009735 [Penicillium longicatenatum]
MQFFKVLAFSAFAAMATAAAIPAPEAAPAPVADPSLGSLLWKALKEGADIWSDSQDDDDDN